MAWIGSQVVLYKECELRVPDGNGGYTYQKFREDELHRPLILTSAVNPHISVSSNNVIGYFNNPQPRKGRLLSEIEVNVDYELFTGLQGQTATPKFMCLTGDAETQHMEIYGWIDRAEPIATKGPKTNTLIHWHVDYWFTLQMMEWNATNYPTYWSTKGLAFGRGTFKRGPAGMARPDPSVPRTWVKTDETEIADSGSSYDAPWIIVLYTMTSNSHTTFRMAYWPAGSATFEYSSVTYNAITPVMIYQGLLEEWMGLDPNAIVGVWFSPIPPASTTGTAVQTGTHTEGSLTYMWFWRTPTNTGGTTITLPNEVGTDDSSKYAVTDVYGTIQAVLPWGITFKTIKLRCDIGSSGAWLLMQFLTGDGSGGLPAGEGRLVQIPLLAAPVTSNALSSYVYSGQEQYDRDMARLQQVQALKSGIAGLGSSAISGAVGGAMAGGPAGAAAGAVGGGVLGGVSVGANYFIQGETNDKSLALTRELMSNQTANVVIAGGGPGWYGNQFDHKWKIVKLSRDPLSKGELEAEQAQKGYVCDTYAVNCTPTIRSGGAMRIEGLEVVGDLSKEARTYIQQMFARGVHLDLIY